METIQIHLQYINFEGQRIFGLSFRKNPDLYQWLRKFQYVKPLKSTGQLTLPADDGYVEIIEIAAKGRIVFNRSRLQKEVIVKGVNKPSPQLNRFEIPKLHPSIRLHLKVAEVEQVPVFLLTTETVLEAKKYLLLLPFMVYDKRLGAFYFERSEVLLAQVLKSVKGTIFIAMHQHVRLKSLLLETLFWTQAYAISISVPDVYLKRLKAANYSKQTIQHYHSSFIIFLYVLHVQHKQVNELMPKEVNDVVLQISTANGYRTSATHIMINAVLFYYRTVLIRAEYKSEIQRPQKEHTLPKVLSKEEIEKIFKHCTNTKHKALLMVMYSGGLRAGEVIGLKVKDIDSKRNVIHIRNGKGFKDRTVMLSEKLKVLLREYY